MFFSTVKALWQILVCLFVGGFEFLRCENIYIAELEGVIGLKYV